MTEHKTSFEDGSYIESTDGVTIISRGEAEGKQAFDAYNLIWLKNYLPFEMRTGMVMSHKQSALDVARAVSGINFRTRKQALAWLGTQIAL